MNALDAWRVMETYANGRTALGMDGIRDPDFPCDSFRRGSPLPPGAPGACETDGHYLCDECVERATCAGCGRRPMDGHCECGAKGGG